MAGGLVALCDDGATLARAAAASVDDIGAAAGRASAKAAGVVVDDTAVTPQYVRGLAAEREIPIVKRIAKGSLRNKLLVLLPVVLLLSQFLPWLLTPILMLGGTYLAFEGAEKIYELVSGHGKGSKDSKNSENSEGGEDGEGADQPAAAQGPETERAMVGGAIRTDFILSAEIMVIALNEVADEPFVARAIILAVVALAITVMVYGVVALIVKLDDIGLHLAGSPRGWVATTGRLLVQAMPKVLTTLSTVGIAAMLWVGGHILLVGVDDLGWHAPYEAVHHLEEELHHVSGIGGLLGWSANTLISAVIGLVVGALVVAVLHLVPRRKAAAGH